jgi:hypothetical protein
VSSYHRLFCLFLIFHFMFALEEGLVFFVCLFVF